MVSLKQLNSLALVFALDSKCGGLHLLQRLRSAKLASTNPACEVTHEVRARAGFTVLRACCEAATFITSLDIPAMRLQARPTSRNTVHCARHLQTSLVYRSRTCNERSASVSGAVLRQPTCGASESSPGCRQVPLVRRS